MSEEKPVEQQPALSDEQIAEMVELARKAMRYRYPLPSKHAKGRAVSKDVIKKREIKRKRKRAISNKSRKINQRWNQK